MATMIEGSCFGPLDHIIRLAQAGNLERASLADLDLQRHGEALRLKAALVGYMCEYDAMREVASAALNGGVHSIPYHVDEL